MLKRANPLLCPFGVLSHKGGVENTVYIFCLKFRQLKSKTIHS